MRHKGCVEGALDEEFKDHWTSEGGFMDDKDKCRQRIAACIPENHNNNQLNVLEEQLHCYKHLQMTFSNALEIHNWL